MGVVAPGEKKNYIYITRLASNEIFSPSNKIHREVGRTKDLSAARYYSKSIALQTCEVVVSFVFT